LFTNGVVPNYSLARKTILRKKAFRVQLLSSLKKKKKNIILKKILGGTYTKEDFLYRNMIDKEKDVVDKDVKDSTQTAASENNEGRLDYVSFIQSSVKIRFTVKGDSDICLTEYQSSLRFLFCWGPCCLSF
jgi:hypothetical protein